MVPTTHGLVSWAIANLTELSRRDRGLILLAGIFPDLDGIGIFFGLEYYSRYHHIVAHNILAGALYTVLCGFFSRRKILTAFLAFLTFHLHLFCDMLGSGPGWPISYFWPFSGVEWYFKYQWNLASWQNLVVTVLALIACFYIAVRRDRTPIEFISTSIDSKVVDTIRKIWPGKLHKTS